MPTPAERTEAASAVPQLAAALSRGRFEEIEVPGREPIPVTVYGERTRGVPVVMLHGLQSHSGWFAQSANSLAEAGHPVYAMDRRGSGLSRSPRGECDGLDEMLADIAAVIEQAKQRHRTDSVHLLGHCFGAIPAAAYTCAHPERVRTLILSTPGLYTYSDLSLPQKLRLAGASLTRREIYLPVPLETEAFTEDAGYQTFIRSDPLSLREATGSFFLSVRDARRSIARHERALVMPVFMACAGGDTICNNRANLEFMQRIPSPRKWILAYPNARHILEFSPEKPVFFRDLAAWLREAEEARP